MECIACHHEFGRANRYTRETAFVYLVNILAQMIEVDTLILAILKNGGRRENLEVKLFGGGRILQNMTDVELRNIADSRRKGSRLRWGTWWIFFRAGWFIFL